MTDSSQRSASTPLESVAGVQLAGRIAEGYETVLTPDALAFVADLVRTFRPRIDALLARRQARQERIDAGDPAHRFDFLEGAADQRARDWTCAESPPVLADRRKKAIQEPLSGFKMRKPA